MRYRIKTYNVTIAQDSQTSQNSVISFSFGIPQYVKNQLVVQSGSPALDAASNKFVQQSIRLIADETRKGYVLCATGTKMTFRDAYYYVNSGNLQINFNYSTLRETANGDTDDLAAIDAMTSNDQFTIEMDWGDEPTGLSGGDDAHNLAQFFGLPGALPQFTYATDQEVIDIVDDVYNAYFPNN